MKKKYVNLAGIYALAAIIVPYFLHVITYFFHLGTEGNKLKLVGFNQDIFILGTLFFLIVALIADKVEFEKDNKFKAFMLTYNISFIIRILNDFIYTVRYESLMKKFSKFYSSPDRAQIEKIESFYDNIDVLRYVLFIAGIILFFLIIRKALKDKKIAN